MEFLEHDLKALQEDMPEPFLASETKTLLRQLASAVDFLHQNHIIHRDLKTSNVSRLPLLPPQLLTPKNPQTLTPTPRSSSPTAAPSNSPTSAWPASSLPHPPPPAP